MDTITPAGLAPTTVPDPWPGALRRGDQVGIRCVFMRGGTSRGAILNAAEVPADRTLLEKLILAIYGSPDVRQIDGLGGADPLTSKVAIVGPATRPDADVDFLFGQVRISEPRVDFSGNCGNLSAAIGPYAIDEGLVPAVEPVTTVRIHLVNLDTVITALVPVVNGVAAAEGTVEVAGVPGQGAGIALDFGEGAGVLGRGILPTGKTTDVLPSAAGDVEVSIIDSGNTTIFVRPEPFGLRGTELPDAFGPEILATLESVRAAGAVRLGLATSTQDAAASSPAIPKLYLVSPPADYVDLAGRTVPASSVDIVARGLSMRVPHKACAGTVAIATGVAAAIPGTVVHAAARRWTGGRFRIGHPSGTIGVDVVVAMGSGVPVIERAAIERTARRIMDGTVWVPAGRVLGT